MFFNEPPVLIRWVLEALASNLCTREGVCLHQFAFGGRSEQVRLEAPCRTRDFTALCLPLSTLCMVTGCSQTITDPQREQRFVRRRQSPWPRLR